VVGLTGTSFRGNGAWLTHGEDPLFTHICTRVTIKELLGLGFLSPLTTVETKTHIDTSDVKTVGGDYVVSELARASDKDELVQAACDEIVVMGAMRRRWLVFCVTVEHAEHVCAALRQRGVAAAVVTGNTPAIVRERIIAAHRTGQIRCLVNVAIATTGYNVKEIDFLVLLRATKSPVLYTQILGRGLRIADGKTDCLVADFTDTVLTLGPVDEIKGKVPGGKRKSEAPHKICENCGNPNPTAVLKCVECGAPFPEPERINHGHQASSAAVLSSQRPQFEVIVPDDVEYRLHHKANAPSSLRVDYKQGYFTVAREWICLSHPGYARRKAENWWMQRSKIQAIPKDAEEAIEWLTYDREILRKPVAIAVSKVGKYPEILNYQWTKHEPATT
jgi:DNA repair protein RadD